MFQKGQSGNPNGRPKGSENVASAKIKKAYAQLVEGNLDRIQGWLDEVAADSPKEALDFLIKLSPFVIPKKTESDVTVDSPIKIVIPPKSDEE